MFQLAKPLTLIPILLYPLLLPFVKPFLFCPRPRPCKYCCDVAVSLLLACIVVVSITYGSLSGIKLTYIHTNQIHGKRVPSRSMRAQERGGTGAGDTKSQYKCMRQLDRPRASRNWRHRRCIGWESQADADAPSPTRRPQHAHLFPALPRLLYAMYCLSVGQLGLSQGRDLRFGRASRLMRKRTVVFVPPSRRSADLWKLRRASASVSKCTNAMLQV